MSPGASDGEEEDPGPTDRTEKPRYYRDNLQDAYDMQIANGKEAPEALQYVKNKFKLKKVTVTPTGEVRSPGVTDDPDPPAAPPAPPPGNDEPPETPDGVPGNPEDPGSSVGSEDPHGKDPEKKKQESFEKVDQEWLDLLKGVYPNASEFDPPEGWAPLDAHHHLLHEATLGLSGTRKRRYEAFCCRVNMSSVELVEHFASASWLGTLKHTRQRKRQVLKEGERLGRATMILLALPLAEWEDEEWRSCGEVVNAINRRLLADGELLQEDRPTRKLLALRALGHNPLFDPIMEADELCALQAMDPALANRTLDDLGLTRVTEVVTERYDGRKGPKWGTLKKNKVKLSDEERTRCHEKKAVWHHGPHGEATSAVWKSVIDGKEWFVTNTHRAFNTAPTLDGAINRYHRFIKGTA